MSAIDDFDRVQRVGVGLVAAMRARLGMGAVAFALYAEQHDDCTLYWFCTLLAGAWFAARLAWMPSGMWVELDPDETRPLLTLDGSTPSHVSVASLRTAIAAVTHERQDLLLRDVIVSPAQLAAVLDGLPDDAELLVGPVWNGRALSVRDARGAWRAVLSRPTRDAWLPPHEAQRAEVADARA